MASTGWTCVFFLCVFLTKIDCSFIRDDCDLHEQPDKIKCSNIIDLEIGHGQLVVEVLELNFIIGLNIHPESFLELTHLIIHESDVRCSDGMIQEFVDADVIVIIDDGICEKLTLTTTTRKTRISTARESTTTEIESYSPWTTDGMRSSTTDNSSFDSTTFSSTAEATIKAEWEIPVIGVLSAMTLITFVALTLYFLRKAVRKRRQLHMLHEAVELEDRVIYVVPSTEPVRRRSLPKSHDA